MGLGKVEMLKTETPRGLMFRRTPEGVDSEAFGAGFLDRERSVPDRFAKNYLGRS